MIKKIFNIYPGEGARAFLFVFLGYLWAQATTTGMKIADVLFLTHVGPASLPQAYIVTACALLVAAAFLMLAIHSYTPKQIFLVVLGVGILFYTAVTALLHAVVRAEIGAWWYILKSGGSVFFFITLTTFWLFVDGYFHLQDAKRLFTLFNASIFIGDAATGLLMWSGILTMKAFFSLTVALLAAASLMAWWISGREEEIVDDTEIEEEDHVQKRSWKHFLYAILTSPFTLFLILFHFVMQLMIIVMEFNYYTAFTDLITQWYPEASEKQLELHLTKFIGQLIIFVGVFNLIMGLFLYSRLVRRWGINNLVLMTPLLSLTALIGWQGSSFLLFPILGFLVVEGTMYSVDDSNFSLLLNAVPSRVKRKTRVVIESFFEPVGMLLSAGLLAFIGSWSLVAGLFLAGIWVVVALLLRSSYFSALFHNLWENSLHTHRSVRDWLAAMRGKERVRNEMRLLAILRQGDSQAEQFSTEVILEAGESSLTQQMERYLDECETETKIALVKRVRTYPDELYPALLDHMKRWYYETQEEELQNELDSFLCERGLLPYEKVIEGLESDRPEKAAASIIALRTVMLAPNPKKAAYHRTMAAQKLEELLESESAEAICEGISVLAAEPGPSHVDMLIPFLHHASLRVVRKALEAIAKIIDRRSLRHAPELIQILQEADDRLVQRYAIRAIGHLDDTSLVGSLVEASTYFRASEWREVEEAVGERGLRVIPILLSLVKNTALHDRPRTLAGKILGQLALPQLRSNLPSIILPEIKRAGFYFYHASLLPREYEGIDLTPLKQTLVAGYQGVITFIIHLLGITGTVEDSELLVRSVLSPHAKVRSQVVEALEKSCSAEIFRLLYPLIGDIPLETRLHACMQEPLSLEALLDTMDQSALLADRIMAATVRYQLQLPGWRERLRQQMMQKEPLFNRFAYELLEVT